MWMSLPRAEQQGDKFGVFVACHTLLPVNLPVVILPSSRGCSFSKVKNIYLISDQLL